MEQNDIFAKLKQAYMDEVAKERNEENDTDEPSEEAPKPIDSIIKVQIDIGGYEAKLIAYAPINGGADITREKVIEELTLAGVVFGINMGIIMILVSQKKYGTWLSVAKSLPPNDGINGSIEFLFNFVDVGIPKEDERGYVDYKDLGIVRNIKAGVTIAKITKETEGTPGINVKNEPLKQMVGKPVKYSFGENIAVSEDGLSLVTTADGNLAYTNGRFVVQTTFKIEGDVDVSTGNIDFTGDVIIRGDVLEGFTVKAGKNINIYGCASSATIIAGGNVIIKNGSIGSTISAEGSVAIAFGENSNISCTSELKSNSLVFCEVFCKGIISCTGGNGTIVGGKIVSTKNVSANNIGSKNYTPTIIVIGDNAIMLEERDAITKKIEHTVLEEEKCIKIVEFLKSKKDQMGGLPEDKLNYLNSAAKTIIMARIERETLEKRVEEIEEYLKTKQDLAVICRKELNPGTKIIINDSVLFVNSLYQFCQVGLGNDGIEVRNL